MIIAKLWHRNIQGWKGFTRGSFPQQRTRIRSDQVSKIKALMKDSLKVKSPLNYLFNEVKMKDFELCRGWRALEWFKFRDEQLSIRVLLDYESTDTSKRRRFFGKRCLQFLYFFYYLFLFIFDDHALKSSSFLCI